MTTRDTRRQCTVRSVLRRSAAVVLAGAWMLAGSIAPAVAATIHVKAERHGEYIDLEASALLAADAPTAWRVLTDYARYPAFIPDLRESRIVDRHGSVVTVRQSGDARLWLLHMPLDLTFEISESPPYRMQSRAVAGSMDGLESQYVIVPAASGVVLRYQGHVAPGFELFGAIEQYAVRENVARQFQALADEIERAGAATAGPAVAGAAPARP
jgi:hypothetical protein